MFSPDGQRLGHVLRRTVCSSRFRHLSAAGPQSARPGAPSGRPPVSTLHLYSRPMERFEATIGPVLHPAHGVSLAKSPDGAVCAALLGSSHSHGQAQAILAAYLASGDPGLSRSAHLAGHVIQDARSGKTQVIVPPIGLRQVYWRREETGLRIASEPSTLVRTGESSDLNAETLYRYVYFHCLPGPSSAFQEVAKLEGGHRLEWNGSQASVSRYWRPRFATGSPPDLTAMKTELHEVLTASVSRALQGARHPGAFLSGGLDSSTVAGVASKLHPGIQSVTMGFDAQGYDEMDYARLASRHFGTRALEYYVTPDDVVSTLPDIAAAFPEPFGNSSAAAAYHCARIAREHGIDRLLAGDGGDEIFGGNERYAKQLVFERYFGIPRPARGALEALVSTAAAITQVFPIGKAQSYIQQARVPLPDRLQSYNFLHRISPGDVFEPDVLREANTSDALRLLREEYAVPADAHPVDRMLFLDWKFTLHDNDLVKVNTMCDLAGVEVVYPMLDPALVDLSMQIPANWKVRGGELRWFYKEAMRGFLPDGIINKSKHGFGLPFGAWMRTHAGLKAMAEDALQSLAKRRYFRKDFLDSALRLHREAHAGYYGELVWILTVLELWLQRHMPRAGR